jgi:hypothetical protein
MLEFRTKCAPTCCYFLLSFFAQLNVYILQHFCKLILILLLCNMLYFFPVKVSVILLFAD